MGLFPWFSLYAALYHTHVCHSELSGNIPVKRILVQRGKEYHSFPICSSVLLISVHMGCVVALVHLV